MRQEYGRGRWRSARVKPDARRTAARRGVSASRSVCRRSLAFESLEDRRLLAVVPAGFNESVVAANLTSPIAIAAEPSGHRLWVAFQDGRLGVIEHDVLLPQMAYTLPCDGTGERGFQGLAFDADFVTNNYIYVYYTAALPESHNRLSRLTVDPTTENSILAGSEVVLLDLPLFSQLPTNQVPIWHMGGAIHFLPDDSIAIQVGDHLNNSIVQNNNAPLGKVLRANKDGTPRVDNPFYNPADTNPPGGADWNGNAPGDVDWIDYVWASGLRNPFSGDVDPATGRYFVNDVGEVTWEEIDDATLAGRNFGWPTTEGTFNPATYPNFTNPVLAYNHGQDCAITGGAFYSPTNSQFPAAYDGVYFYSQFCTGVIRYVDPDNPTVDGTFATGAEYPMNIEVTADGTLYYIARGAGAGGAPGIGTGTIRKVQFGAQTPPQIVQQPASKLVSLGYDATFAVSASGAGPLTYQWQRHNGAMFVDLPNATEPTLAVNDVTLTDNGAQYRVVVTNMLGSATSNVATLTVTADTPPTPTIATPLAGSRYVAGNTISFSGTASDVEDGALGAAAMTWQVDFHHNTHSHPFLPPASGVSAGSFVIPTIGETAADVFYRITLTVTDSAGLSTTIQRDVQPITSNFTVMTNFGGGQVLVDGQTEEAPLTMTGVVNVERTLTAPLTQLTPGGELATFLYWQDGETNNTRTISTPTTSTAYVAIYANASNSLAFLSDLPIANDPAPNGWGPIERDMSNGEAAPGDGVPMAIQGLGYAKGLGVHAASDVRFNLGGSFERFIADIGVDDETGNGGSVAYQVYGDGNLLFSSATLTGSSAAQKVDVGVAGVNVLRLVVGEAGDGNGLDHANWSNARLIGTQTGTQIHINFQNAGAPVPAGYLADVGFVFANRGNGQSYGWSTDHTDVARDRNINVDQRLDTLNQFHAGQKWELVVPNGVYAVTMSIGDPQFASTHTLNVEGVSFWNAATLNPNQFRQRTLLVTVADGRLTLDQGSAGERATRPNYIEVIPTAAPSLFPLKLGDFDGDSDVDGSDFLRWQRGLGATSAAHSQGDGDEDGDVDGADLAVWRATFATNFAATPADLSVSAPAGVVASAAFDGVTGDVAKLLPTQLVTPPTASRPSFRSLLPPRRAFDAAAPRMVEVTAPPSLNTERSAAITRDAALERLVPDWLDVLAEQGVKSMLSAPFPSLRPSARR
jgi:glucose/arabinose dehydrogenase